MSEVTNVTEEVKTDQFSIDVDQEDKLKFPTLASSDLTSTDELCRWANMLFGDVFADYDGCVPKFNTQTGRLTLSLFFKQVEQSDGELYAFESAMNNKGNESNSGLRRIQRLENTVMNGNKFTLTDSAKSALAKFMAREVKNSHGEVNWSRLDLVTQHFEPAYGSYGARGTTSNVINFVDPREVLRELYGTTVETYVGKDENGAAVFEQHETDYEIIVIRAIAMQMPGMQVPEEGPFQIDIRQVDKQQLIESQKQLGVTTTFGKRIIRERS